MGQTLRPFARAFLVSGLMLAALVPAAEAGTGAGPIIIEGGPELRLCKELTPALDVTEDFDTWRVHSSGTACGSTEASTHMRLTTWVIVRDVFKEHWISNVVDCTTISVASCTVEYDLRTDTDERLLCVAVIAGNMDTGAHEILQWPPEQPCFQFG